MAIHNLLLAHDLLLIHMAIIFTFYPRSKNISVIQKINLIVDEYDGEVLDEAKTQRTCFECYKVQK